MKKGWIAFSIIVSLTILQAGIVIGGRFGSNREDRQTAELSPIADTIAVINMDMGIEIVGGIENYSSSIINTLSDRYTLVSANMAYNGYQNGNYGAVITFPADVSEKILSFNSSSPERVRLEYMINPFMPEEQYIDMYKEIMLLQLSLNSAISYMTVSSIFQEFQNSQDEINYIFENDQTDMMALDEIKHGNFTERIDLSDIPTVEFEPHGIDMSPYMDGIADAIDQVSLRYLDSYALAKNYYDKLSESMTVTIGTAYDTAEQWLLDVDNWSDDVKENLLIYETELSEYRDIVTTSIAMVPEYNDDLIQWHTELSDWYTTADEWHDTMLHYHDDFTQCIAELDAYLKDLDDYLTLLASYRAKMDVYINDMDLFMIELDEQLNELDICLTELELDLPKLEVSMDNIDRPVIHLNLSLPDATTITLPAEYEGISTFDREGFADIMQPEPMDMEGLPTSPQPDELIKLMEVLGEQLDSYDTDDYLSDSVKADVNVLLGRYEVYLEIVSMDLGRQYVDNLLQLHTAHAEYNNHFGEWRQAALAAQSSEQERLQEILGEFYIVKHTTSVDNFTRLSSFASRMPESRTTAGINSDLVAFTVQPFEFMPPAIRTVTHVDINSNDSYQTRMMVVLLSLMSTSIATLILLGWLHLKKSVK